MNIDYIGRFFIIYVKIARSFENNTVFENTERANTRKQRYYYDKFHSKVGPFIQMSKDYLFLAEDANI